MSVVTKNMMKGNSGPRSNKVHAAPEHALPLAPQLLYPYQSMYVPQNPNFAAPGMYANPYMYRAPGMYGTLAAPPPATSVQPRTQPLARQFTVNTSDSASGNAVSTNNVSSSTPVKDDLFIRNYAMPTLNPASREISSLPLLSRTDLSEAKGAASNMKTTPVDTFDSSTHDIKNLGRAVETGIRDMFAADSAKHTDTKALGSTVFSIDPENVHVNIAKQDNRMTNIENNMLSYAERLNQMVTRDSINQLNDNLNQSIHSVSREFQTKLDSMKHSIQTDNERNVRQIKSELKREITKDFELHMEELHNDIDTRVKEEVTRDVLKQVNENVSNMQSELHRMKLDMMELSSMRQDIKKAHSKAETAMAKSQMVHDQVSKSIVTPQTTARAPMSVDALRNQKEKSRNF